MPVFFITNISTQAVSIFVELNTRNNDILEGFSGYVKIIPNSFITIEQNRVKTGQVDNLQKLKKIDVKRGIRTVFEDLDV